MTSMARICIKTSSIQGFFEYFFKTYFWFICQFVGECKNTCRFHRFFSSCVAPQTRNLGGIPAITFTDCGREVSPCLHLKRFDMFDVWKKWEQGRKGRKGRKKSVWKMKESCALWSCVAFWREDKAIEPVMKVMHVVDLSECAMLSRSVAFCC